MQFPFIRIKISHTDFSLPLVRKSLYSINHASSNGIGKTTLNAKTVARRKCRESLARCYTTFIVKSHGHQMSFKGQ